VSFGLKRDYSPLRWGAFDSDPAGSYACETRSATFGPPRFEGAFLTIIAFFFSLGDLRREAGFLLYRAHAAGAPNASSESPSKVGGRKSE
jgi:hypothetical protein